jgi:hypothetical protein
MTRSLDDLDHAIGEAVDKAIDRRCKEGKDKAQDKHREN